METTSEVREGWLEQCGLTQNESHCRQVVALCRDVDTLVGALDTVHSVFRKDVSGFPIEYMVAVMEYVGELLDSDGPKSP